MAHKCCIPFIAILMFLSATFALGQAVSLQEQLSAQYQVAKVSGGSGGAEAFGPGRPARGAP